MNTSQTITVTTLEVPDATRHSKSSQPDKAPWTPPKKLKRLPAIETQKGAGLGEDLSASIS